MISKRQSKTGLGEPDITGVSGLFETGTPVANDPTVAKGTATDRTTPSSSTSNDLESKPADRVKTSVSLDQNTIELLYDLKKVARQQEGRFVSQGELLDRAVYDLAEKLGILEAE